MFSHGVAILYIELFSSHASVLPALPLFTTVPLSNVIMHDLATLIPNRVASLPFLVNMGAPLSPLTLG